LFDRDLLPADRAKNRSLTFDALVLDATPREFNPSHLVAEGALFGQFCHRHPDTYGNWVKIIEKE